MVSFRNPVDSEKKNFSIGSLRPIPTLLFFKNGEIVDKQVGYVPKAALAQKLDGVL